MLSSKFSKEKIYYEIKNPLQKNRIKQNKKNNNPFNLTNLNYQVLNSTHIQKKSNSYYNLFIGRLPKDNVKEKNLNNKRYIGNLSPKFILNKSSSTKLLNEKMDYDSFYYNDDNSILKQKILKKLKSAKKTKLINFTNSPHQTSYDNNKNLYCQTIQNHLLRKPVVIKFEKGININNIYNNSNIYNNNNDKIHINEIKKINKLSLTENRYKNKASVDFDKKHELFRNFDDLEKKSIEISKRSILKKNFSNKNFFDIKKDNNLKEIKQSLDAIRTKNKSKKKIGNNKIYNNTINNQKYIKTIYHVTKNKIKKNNYKNNSLENIKKLFIKKNNNLNTNSNSDYKRRGILSPYIIKRYVEDNIPETVLAITINQTKNNLKGFYKNVNKRKFNQNILPSISEEEDKIKINITNLVNILEKIINNRYLHIVRDSFRKIIEEKKINKNLNQICNTPRIIPNFKYVKKIIPKIIDKNKKHGENTIIKKNKLIITNKVKQNKFGIFRKKEKIKENE